VTDGLDAVFNPRRIALVGASDRAGTMGRLLWDNLRDFPGEVVPISRSASIDGTRAYADLTEVPGDIDLAVIGAPADRVLGAIRAAAEKRVRAAVVLTAGFAEIGADGARLQEEVVAAARAGGVRLVGPNCFGVQNCDLPLNASIAPGAPAGDERGGISLVTQSGSYGMAVHALGLDEAMRFAKVYAAGNKAEISDAETLAYLRDDPATRVVCLLLESITDPREFFAQARRTTAVKPPSPDEAPPASAPPCHTPRRWHRTPRSATPRWNRQGWFARPLAWPCSTRPSCWPPSRSRRGAGSASSRTPAVWASS
jgi:acetyltransferase